MRSLASPRLGGGNGPNNEMSRRRQLAIALAILIAALAVRLPALFSGLPYSSYVDEGHLLHLVVPVLAGPSWTPNSYYYPTFPVYMVAGAATAYSPIYRAVHGRPFRADLPPTPYRYYDLMGPAELLVIARAVCLVFALGLVALVGRLAFHVAGTPAGLSAGWIAALVPALVARSAIATVNSPATFFVVAALLCAELARRGDRLRGWAVAAGACTGLAGACKYPAALVAVAVALAVLLAPKPWRERVLALFLAGAAAIGALVVAMPAVLLRTRDVIAALHADSAYYAEFKFGNYWHQAVTRAEWDLPLDHPEVGLPLLLLAGAGLVVGLRERRWAPAVVCWTVFGVAMGALLAGYTFRPFRNLLPLVPLLCVLVGLLHAHVRARLTRPIVADLAAAILPVVLFAPALTDYGRSQLALEDSRHVVARWLVDHVRRHERVLVLEELVFQPAELAAIRARTPVDVKPWRELLGLVGERRYRYVVMGRLMRRDGTLAPTPARVAAILEDYAMAMNTGLYPIPATGGTHRGSAQAIFVLRRRGRPGWRPPRASVVDQQPPGSADTGGLSGAHQQPR